jgi:uncharacterized protein (TIGR03083 family)
MPSLLPGWRVRDVFGHMTATARMTPPRFLAKMAAAGLRFHTMSARDVRAHTAGTTADQLADFAGILDATTSPPGPVEAMLGEAVVHSEDIRRPLGITRAYPVEALVRTADFYKGSNLLIGAKRRIAGVTLRATDTEWEYGSGQEVRGPLLSLVMAMTGRGAAVADLSGHGVPAFSQRFGR